MTGALTIGDVGTNTKEEIDHTARGAAAGANFGWPCFEGTATRQTTGVCAPPLANYIPPVHDYDNPSPGSAAISAGFVVRDLTVPSLLGRFVYADTYQALGGNSIHGIDLTPSGASGNGPIPGLTANTVVSFGEDACGHVYVAEFGGAVSRIEPAGGTSVCAPQQLSDLPGPASQSPPAARDTAAPRLRLGLRGARRAAKAGEVRVRIGCDEACTVEAGGRIALPGKDIGLGSDRGTLPAGGSGALVLTLSGDEEGRVRRALADGAKATTVISVRAADPLGNAARVGRRVKQKR